MERWVTNSRLIQVLLLLTAAFVTPAVGQTNQTNETDWFNIGIDLYKKDKYDEAIQAYDKALEVDPQDAEAWNNKGIALGMQGRYNEALEAFGKAVEINSSYAEAWYNMGAIFDLQERYFRAIWAYNKATLINPRYQKAWEAKNEDIGIVGMRNYLDFIHDGYS